MRSSSAAPRCSKLERHVGAATAPLGPLSRASVDGELNRALAVYAHPHVLVVDEVGYLSCGPDAANVLFHLVSKAICAGAR